MLTKLPKSFKSPPPSSGFTLIEVLASVAISVVIFSLAGWASANLLQNKYKTSADSEVRNNLNRATEFIADEVRQAETIINDETLIKTDDLLEQTEYTSETDQVVLALEHPNYGTRQIIYYTTPPGNDWEIGPRVLRRWGPPLDNDGNYGAGDWVDAPIVDRLAAKEAVADDSTGCGALNRVPDLAEQADGFFVCVSNGQDLVRLRLNAQVNLTSSTGGQQDKVIYTTDTKSFARLAQSISETPDIVAPPPPPPPPSVEEFPEYYEDKWRLPNLPFQIKAPNLSLHIKRDAEFIATYPSINNKTTDCSSCKIEVGENSYSLSNNPLMEGKNPDQVTVAVTLNGETFSSNSGTNNNDSQSVEFWDYINNPYTDVNMQNNQVLVVFKVEQQEFFILLSFRDKLPAEGG